MSQNIQHKRGTKADFEVLAGTAGLLVSQLYHLTDTDEIALATSSSTYELFTRGGWSLTYAGRVQFYTDLQWAGFSNASYGPTYHAWSQSHGTGANPVMEWEDMGIMIPPGRRLTSIGMLMRASNTEVQDIEISANIVETPIARALTGLDADGEINYTEVYRDFWMNPVVGDPATGVINDFHYRQYHFDLSVSASPQQLRVAWKPVGTLTATRYAFTSVFVELA